MREIRFKTRRYGNSFVPSTIRLWNALPLDIRRSENINQFKSNLKSVLLSVDFVPHYFSYGNRFSSICHTQLRLGYSRLNSHLFQINVVSSAACDCHDPCENVSHFFLKCPRYAAPRTHLLKTVCKILAPGVNPTLIVHLAPDILLKYLTHGNKDIPDNLNEQIFYAVQQFIMQTRRFVY